MITESDQIIQSLGYGQENAISAERLQNITGLNDRNLRFVIQALRQIGFCILSGPGGYWLPSQDAETGFRECKQFSRTMKARAITSLQTARTTDKYMRSIDGQTTIDDFNGVDPYGD